MREAVVRCKENLQAAQFREVRRQVLQAAAANVEYFNASQAADGGGRQRLQPFDAHALDGDRQLSVQQLLQRELLRHTGRAYDHGE